ncbi:hypothetical protein ACIP2Z_00445 [Streptomyces iakyrus]|uniref:DUF4333 domain-containing protein n=1 Tax=Streptomyces iakyrus TaxID=68219 RepID=A0ABW8F5U7_9ACTN
MSCPTGLKAVAGAMITCTGKGGDGRDVDIPVRVVRADSHSRHLDVPALTPASPLPEA